METEALEQVLAAACARLRRAPAKEVRARSLVVVLEPTTTPSADHPCALVDQTFGRLQTLPDWSEACPWRLEFCTTIGTSGANGDTGHSLVVGHSYFDCPASAPAQYAFDPAERDRYTWDLSEGPCESPVRVHAWNRTVTRCEGVCVARSAAPAATGGVRLRVHTVRDGPVAAAPRRPRPGPASKVPRRRPHPSSIDVPRAGAPLLHHPPRRCHREVRDTTRDVGGLGDDEVSLQSPSVDESSYARSLASGVTEDSHPSGPTTADTPAATPRTGRNANRRGGAGAGAAALAWQPESLAAKSSRSVAALAPLLAPLATDNARSATRPAVEAAASYTEDYLAAAAWLDHDRVVGRHGVFRASLFSDTQALAPSQRWNCHAVLRQSTAAGEDFGVLEDRLRRRPLTASLVFHHPFVGDAAFAANPAAYSAHLAEALRALVFLS